MNRAARVLAWWRDPRQWPALALVVVASAVFIVRFLLHLRAATRDAPRVTLAHGVP